MPEALPLTDDLIQLQRTRLDAEAELGDYVHAVETRRRELYPDPEQYMERRWTPEENAELDRLRAARDQLALQVRQHPVIQQALAERCWPQTWDALRDAARALPTS